MYIRIGVHICMCMGARVFSAFQPLLLCMTSLFSFFVRRRTMATYFSFCFPSLCYTLFCAFQPPEISYLFIVCACHLQLFFLRLEAASFFPQKRLYERSLLSCVCVCVLNSQKRMFYDFYTAFYPMCILISKLLFSNCMSLHAQKYAHT